MEDRAEFIRERMRQSWGARYRRFAEHAAPQTAAFSDVLIAKVRPAPGERVLDVATGSGVVALRAAAAVGPSGEVVATDLVPEWAEVIAEETAKAGLANVTFRTMGAEALDLPDRRFDLALCQFGLMFVPDPVQALREMRRVLRDGGRLGVVVWSTPERVSCFTVDRLLMALTPPLPAAEQLPSPLSLGEPGLIERHVAAAGFRDVVADRQTLDYVVDDPGEHWRFKTEGAPAPLAAALAGLSPEAHRRLQDDVLTTLERHRHGDRILLPSEAIYVTAVR